MKTLLVFGTQRSGHHAIIHWVARNMTDGVVFYNDCDLKAFLTGRRVYRGKYKLRKFALAGQDTTHEIYNFEDININQHPKVLESPLIHDYHKTIIPIRDVYNMVASSIKSTPNNTKQRVQKRVRRWTEQVEEVLGLTGHVPEGKKVFVSYNLWVEDREYRDIMAMALGFKNQDIGVDTISPYGGGSSFNNHGGDASKLKVFERYRDYLDNDIFNSVITGKVDDLNRQLFGFDIKDLRDGYYKPYNHT